MKAVRVHAYGQPPVIENVDRPRATGPWDVVVKVGGAGLCRTDLHIVAGLFEKIQHPTLPYTLGHETAGWVAEVGSAVATVAVGDAVILHVMASCGFCAACRAGNDAHCVNVHSPGIDVDGGMAEYVRTNVRALVKLGPGIEPAAVAALADAGVTAYHAIHKALPLLPPGSHAVVIGAGGLGHIGIQILAATSAAEITVIDRSGAALALAGELGADHRVLAAGDRDVAAQVREITGRGADVVFDFVGEGGTELLSPRLVRDGGSIYVIGYGGAMHVPTIEFIAREISVVGNLVGNYTDLVELMALVARDKVHLRTRTYPLAAALDALADLEDGRIVGRGILVP